MLWVLIRIASNLLANSKEYLQPMFFYRELKKIIFQFLSSNPYLFHGILLPYCVSYTVVCVMLVVKYCKDKNKSDTWKIWYYHKTPKYLDNRKIAVIILKF